MTAPGAVAELRLPEEPRALFVATECTLDGPLVHATGRWRRRVGINHEEFSWTGEASYTWAIAPGLRIKWLTETAR